MALILKVGGKPAVSNLCEIMVPEGKSINNVKVDYRYVGPGSIAYTVSNDKRWRLGEDFKWYRMVNTGGGGGGGSDTGNTYGVAIYGTALYG